jgi:uncharacterized membrane protein
LISVSDRRYKKKNIVPVSKSDVSPNVERPNISVQAAKFQAEFFSGPVPPPSLLARYNDVIPDGAERILAMAERQSKHREILESQVITGNISAQKMGSIFAFIICLVAVVGGFSLIWIGKSADGLAAIIASLTALAGVFVYGKRQQRKEREGKSDALSQRRKQ